MKKQAQEFATARARITKQLADVGYTPPAMDKNFSVDLAEFNAGADDFFRKKYVNDCVTGADQGVAIPISDILNSLRQKSTGSQGTATNDYKVALQNILNSNAMMQDKMDQIKALEATYTDITVTYKDASASRITDTPYNLFMKTIAKCSQKYSADPTFSSKGSSGVAYQTKVNRAKAALQELKSLNDNFTSKIASAVNSQVLNCNGAGVKAGGDNCTEDTLKSSSPDFCIDHASTCANQMQGCYAEANQQVATRKAKMDGLAKTFNANVSAMIARSNQLFESQKAAVTNMTKLIQQRFPGTNFVIPANLFVSTPEMKKDTFGVDLMGDGDLKSILDGQDSMPNKIEGLKKIFADQQKTVDASMDNYYALQQNAMKENAGKWAALSSKCTDAIKTSQKSLADANAQGQAAQAKQDAQVAKFCKKYNSISQNPIGACGKARDLADTTDEISARLTGKAESVTQQYANACDGYMNQSDDLSKAQDCSDLKGTAKKDCEAINHRIATGGTSTKKKSKKSVNLKSLCGSDVNATDKDFFSNLSNQLSDSDKDKLSSVDNLSDALKKSDDLDDNGFLSNIADIVPDKSKGICNQINKSITPPADYDEVENTKKIDDALTALNKKDITDADRKVQNIVLTDANKAKKAADKAKQTSDQIDRLMADLDEVKNPAPLSKDEQAVKLVQDIGEQATGPCDMQASNTNVNKMFQFDLNNHDQSVLGSSGRSQ